MRNRSSILANVDIYILISYVVLILIGCLNLYATTYTEEISFPSYQKQFLWAGLAFTIALLVMITDAKFYESFSYILYVLFMVLLASVLVFGQENKGAKSWFEIGSIAIQPTEFAKFATALAISRFLSSYNIRVEHFKTKAIVFLLLFLPIGLILLQPDAGSALVFLSIYFALYREGFPEYVLTLGFLAVFLFLLTVYFIFKGWYINYLGFSIPYIVFVVPIASYFFLFINSRKKKNLFPRSLFYASIIVVYIFSVNFLFTKALEQRHRNRILQTMSLVDDKKGVGYNVNQSKIAIGSGGFLGKGFLNGTQTKYDFVPEQRTDFIFCTIGEEWGFLGSTAIVGIYLFFLTRLLIASERQKSRFSKIYGYCVTSIFFFHFAINIGMTIGLVPVIGIPLPFLSYGGSSLWAFTILLFIFLKLDSERKFILS